MLSQNTKHSLTISNAAFDLILKDLQKWENLKIAYEIQTADLLQLASVNSTKLKAIEKLQLKSEFYQQQVDQQQQEITKLTKKKSKGLTWLSIGLTGGLIIGVLIAN